MTEVRVIITVATDVVFAVLWGILVSGVRVAAQWERGVVLRLGKFLTIRGPGILYSPHSGLSIAFSADGQRIVSRGVVWNAETGELMHTFTTTGGWGDVAFSPDGWRIASAEQWQIRVWDTQADCDPITFMMPQEARSVAFSTASRTRCQPPFAAVPHPSPVASLT
jgi:WD40 repeat protein